MSKVCVLGAGSWGTALASVLDENGHEVLIWARRQDQVDEINNKNTNEISDYEYDKLKRKILEIEEKYPEFTDKNGVRNRVGGRKSL